jgi:colicin import membrane protein
MSTLAYTYPEPYKLPSGLLAVLVHGVFFSLLFFGVNWHSKPPESMEVEIWDRLPETQTEPAKIEPLPVPPIEVAKPIEQPKPVEVAPPPKAEIELIDKKKTKNKPAQPPKAVENTQAQLKLAAQAQAEQAAQAAQNLQAVKDAQAALIAKAAQAEQERLRAARASEIARIVKDYSYRIKAKIKPNIVDPPDVPDNAQAEFTVILLPGGAVLSTKLTKSSGSAAYDEAVDRAILKTQTLPLPPDVDLFNNFRELHLKFKPKE